MTIKEQLKLTTDSALKTSTFNQLTHATIIKLCINAAETGSSDLGFRESKPFNPEIIARLIKDGLEVTQDTKDNFHTLIINWK